MIILRDVTLSRGNKILLQKASVSLNERQKIGLVGLNGCGKSSLFGLLLGELSTDAGDFSLNSYLRISHLSQQIPDSEQNALDYVLSGDKAYYKVHQKLTKAEQMGDDETIVACHNELVNIDGYSKPAKAATIMSGLGFSTAEQSFSVNHFSGGWRMRLSLARCLMSPADLLLLDEPTNHLDMEAIYWLEKWLKNFPGSIILISHDRDFLDVVVTHILHIEQQNIKLYTGNYSSFEKTRAQQLALQQAQYEKQQLKVTHLMSFVNRFKAKASKAKQAQSRLKAISKMELVAQAQLDSPFSFEFYPCPKAGKPLLNCEEVTVGYENNKIVLKKFDINIAPGDRIALLGPNGEGKSTLIKTLTGELIPISGNIQRNAHLHVGYFAQHQLEQLDLDLSPIETIQVLTSDAREQSIRNFLGGFNFIGDMATNPIRYFSGGEKARLVLAKLVWQKPNLLLLDEPTNHLDLEMRAALEIALQSYEGALILISHDRHLINAVVDDFYLVFNQQVQTFQGALEDYYQWLQSKDTSKNNKKVTQPSVVPVNKSLQNRLKKLEEQLEVLKNKLQKNEATLANETLYNEENAEKLQTLLNENKTMHDNIQRFEEEWLSLIDEV